ncbi:hypothetical protein Slin15195_G126660 [Septoria linicola]|uniref:Uncharacterized protein n=1 Tax=Septoria linicola TaxID=215465 RepID=A0A9Q9B0B5_9PEZI|nr:hypothetical protein Slin14017_G082840 [Septoria linicola]USW59347.1 hypothetical protein Slin15195_G126660 [Septoria linicola]
MDSPSFQSAIINPNRIRSQSSYSTTSTVNSRGGIQKRSINNDRSRAISVSQAEKLFQFAAQQASQADIEHPIPTSTAIGGIQWLTPQHSPQPQSFTAEPSLEPFPQWTAPTPPRSESSFPTVSIDCNEEPATTGISVTPEFAFEQPPVSAEMSSLGFLLPTTYGSSPYESDSNNYAMDQNYIPPMRVSQPTTTSGASAYANTVSSSSPSLYSTRVADTFSARRHSEMPATTSAGSAYGDYRRVSSPYESNYTMAPSQTIPSISGLTQSPLPSPHIGSSSMSQYNRSPNMYESNPYGQAYTTAPSQAQIYGTSQQSYPAPFVGSSVNENLAKSPGSDSTIRVLNQRPKPQCWEHGCNGRQFSTFSNLLRHQREKSGTSAKSYCPKCGAEFTRTTARNGHLAHDKCTKQRRPSDGK